MAILTVHSLREYLIQLSLKQKLYKKRIIYSVVASTHPLSNKEVTLQQLQDYPLILREPDSGTREILKIGYLKETSVHNHFKQLLKLGVFY